MTQVIYEENGGVARIFVNRPEAMNALSKPIIDEMEELLDKIALNHQIKVLIVGGNDNFAAGADIKGMVECNPEEAKSFAFNSCYNKLMNLAIPTIAAIGGYALGGGLELALSCDLRIATEEAKLALPEVNLGIAPGAGGSIRLPRLVGYSKACELILLGKQIDGKTAEKIGMVNLAVPKEELLSTAIEWAEKLAKKAPVALRTAKRVLREGLTCSTVEEGVELEAEAWSELFATQDQKEGMRAFVEKRKPVYQGK